MLYPRTFIERQIMVRHEQLHNPPLVEALLEIKWELEQIASGVFRDPGFSVAHQRFYNQVKDRLGFIEALPTVQIPDELTAHINKYRYRVGENEWPLVQIGPGIATLNFTTPYNWGNFLENAKQLIPDLLKAYEDYPLTFSSLLLRYINAEPFDFETRDLLSFMQTSLNTQFQPPAGVAASQFKGGMKGANWTIQYELIRPQGIGTLKFSTGATPEGIRSVIWEQAVQSTGDQVPQPDDKNNTAIIEWLELAHEVIESWFLSIVNGELLQKYKGGSE